MISQLLFTLIIKYLIRYSSEKGRLGEYESIGSCSKTCGGGKITKRRQCLPPYSHTGQVCYEDCTADREEKTEDCNTQRCFNGIEIYRLVKMITMTST